MSENNPLVDAKQAYSIIERVNFIDRHGIVATILNLFIDGYNKVQLLKTVEDKPDVKAQFDKMKGMLTQKDGEKQVADYLQNLKLKNQAVKQRQDNQKRRLGNNTTTGIDYIESTDSLNINPLLSDSNSDKKPFFGGFFGGRFGGAGASGSWRKDEDEADHGNRSDDNNLDSGGSGGSWTEIFDDFDFSDDFKPSDRRINPFNPKAVQLTRKHAVFKI